MRLTPYRVAAAAAVAAASLAIACIPHPKDDYEDFLARTAHLKPDSGPVDASFDARPPDEAEEGLYAAICVSSLAARDPGQALRFYTRTQFTPGEPDGKLTLNLIALRGWDDAAQRPVAPDTVSMSEARCCPASTAQECTPPLPTQCDGFTSDEATVSADGRFTANFSIIRLPSAANSISGRIAVIENVRLQGRFGAGDRFCAGLAAQLTAPYGFTFDPNETTCLFQKVNEGDPLPEIDSAEFACAI